MRKLKKLLALAMATTLVVGVVATPVDAAKKPKLNNKKLELTVGATKTLKVKNISKKTKVKWSSSKKKIASVSKKGKVTAKNPGTAKITATVGKTKLICKVTVKTTVTTPTVPNVTPTPQPQTNPTTVPEPVVTHTHSFTETITKQATCAEAGVKTLTCSCGESKTEEIPALGHKPDGIFISTATCTEDGEWMDGCDVCGDLFSVGPCAALGHEYDDEYTVDKTAGCGSEGYKSRHCKRYEDCWSKIDEVTIPPVVAPGAYHKYKKEVIDPHVATVKYICTVCDYSYTEFENPADYLNLQ